MSQQPFETVTANHWAYQVETPFLEAKEWLEESSTPTRITWKGTADQIGFREEVLREAIARKSKERPAQRDLMPSEMRPVPNTRVAMGADAAEAAGRLIAAANSDLAAETRSSDADAARTVRISAFSGYRSNKDQDRVWKAHFEGYYQDTASARDGLPGGPHGRAAVLYMLDCFHIPQRVAAPGWSNHQNGIAIDFHQVRAKGHAVQNSTRPDAKRKWRATWFYRWLKRRASSFGFTPYSREPWHWEYTLNGSPGTGTGSMTAREVDQVMYALTDGQTLRGWDEPVAAGEDAATARFSATGDDEATSDWEAESSEWAVPADSEWGDATPDPEDQSGEWQAEAPSGWKGVAAPLGPVSETDTATEGLEANDISSAGDLLTEVTDTVHRLLAPTLSFEGTDSWLGQMLRDVAARIAVRNAMQRGERDTNTLVDAGFAARHPSRPSGSIDRDDPQFGALRADWLDVLNRIVRPALAEGAARNASASPRSPQPMRRMYNRAGAMAYARKYWLKPCDDQFIALRSESNFIRVPLGTKFVHMFATDGKSLGKEEAMRPDGSTIPWEHLDDCTHFISCCIGERPGEACGGLRLTYRQLGSPPTAPYGITRVATMVDYLTGRKGHPKLAEIVAEKTADVKMISGLEPGDLIAYFNTESHVYTHLAMLLDGGLIGCHSYGRSDQPDCTWKSYWNIGSSNHQWTLLHVIA
jgi:hypothetical protein